MMLMLSFLALVTGTVVMALELAAQGEWPPWNTSSAAVSATPPPPPITPAITPTPSPPPPAP
jgi:hypothetical protein